MWKARVFVTLKKSVLDPQGKAVNGTLHTLGYDEVKDVRVGKYLEVILNVNSRDEAAARLEEMSQKVFSNPVIEDYTYELVEVTT